jgi:hypothetical protein
VLSAAAAALSRHGRALARKFTVPPESIPRLFSPFRGLIFSGAY